MASDEHLVLAKSVLQTVLSRFQNYSQYLSAVCGPSALTASQAMNVIQNYTSPLKIKQKDQLKIQYKRTLSVPFAITGHTLFIRLPFPKLTSSHVLAMCDHEIGTHFLRSLNQSKQSLKSRSLRDELGLSEVLAFDTEEGLATLHTVINNQVKILFKPALHYYACCMAEKLPFVDLYHHLANYMDKVDDCWEETVRLKRGVPAQACGVYAKDQVYFRGAIKVLRHRRVINWKLLYSCRVALEDLYKIEQHVDLNKVVLPAFLKDEQKYLDRLDDVVEQNGLFESVGYGDLPLPYG
ncbi:hypothetical protein GEMRC1_007758 [Eukaryota sp. GEM-RC1]